jgi:hypothetical protein
MTRRRALLAALPLLAAGGCLSRLNDVDGDGVPDVDDPAPFDASRPRDGGGTTPAAGTDRPPTARPGTAAPRTDPPTPTGPAVTDADLPPVPAPGSDATRVWPVATDASDGRCRDAGGDRNAATGEGAATWFEYGGCGSWKAYPATPGDRVLLRATTDGGVLTDASFAVEDRIDGSWRRRGASRDPLGRDAAQTFAYTPESDRFRVVDLDAGATGVGFYLEVYRP